MNATILKLIFAVSLAISTFSSPAPLSKPPTAGALASRATAQSPTAYKFVGKKEQGRILKSMQANGNNKRLKVSAGNPETVQKALGFQKGQNPNVQEMYARLETLRTEKSGFKGPLTMIEQQLKKMSPKPENSAVPKPDNVPSAAANPENSAAPKPENAPSAIMESPKGWSTKQKVAAGTVAALAAGSLAAGIAVSNSNKGNDHIAFAA